MHHAAKQIQLCPRELTESRIGEWEEGAGGEGLGETKQPKELKQVGYQLESKWLFWTVQ